MKPKIIQQTKGRIEIQTTATRFSRHHHTKESVHPSLTTVGWISIAQHPDEFQVCLDSVDSSPLWHKQAITVYMYDYQRAVTDFLEWWCEIIWINLTNRSRVDVQSGCRERDNIVYVELHGGKRQFRLSHYGDELPFFSLKFHWLAEMALSRLN